MISRQSEHAWRNCAASRPEHSSKQSVAQQQTRNRTTDLRGVRLSLQTLAISHARLFVVSFGRGPGGAEALPHPPSNPVLDSLGAVNALGAPNGKGASSGSRNGPEATLAGHPTRPQITARRRGQLIGWIRPHPSVFKVAHHFLPGWCQGRRNPTPVQLLKIFAPRHMHGYRERSISHHRETPARPSKIVLRIKI
jgi:hypothetical protein